MNLVPYVHKAGIKGKYQKYSRLWKIWYNPVERQESSSRKGATIIQERLGDLHKDKGLNLEEPARLTQISKSALASYESKDNKEINHGNLITLADFYGVSIDYLLCRTENRE